MRRLTKLIFFALILCHNQVYSQTDGSAKWISTMTNQSATNTWLAYRKTIDIKEKPAQAVAKIAADSKYWLWINGKLAVFEGALKRGPNPTDTYYDEVDLAPYLNEGKNSISVLVWFFGKDGFSHKSSGKAGLFFECRSQGLELVSNKDWKCLRFDAYQTAGFPYPNFRLPESSLLYDARKSIGNWQQTDFDDGRMPGAMELGREGAYPWNKLIKRPIPLFKDFGLKNYANQPKLPFVSNGDTIVCDLPYNAQITPYLKIESEEGERIVMGTDNYLFFGGETQVRAEYISKKGIQEYENLGWLNGHKVYYFIPKGVKVLELKYRETGYDTEFAGSFSSSSPFLNALWKKAQRTLYINMRDTYMDCPDRERAQWTGDAVNESSQAFYSLSTSSHALAKKWLYELIHWQKEDSSLFSPSPAGNWNNELPGQSMASIGYYGLWNYYLHSGDKQALIDLYPGSKRYLDSWKLNEKGTIIFRPGGWTWGDWGDHRDMLLLYNLWYYIGLKGMYLTALEIGEVQDAEKYLSVMQRFKTSFNNQFWNGEAYRDPQFKGSTDDRTQALAVLSGIAGQETYPSLLKVFQKEFHASPYMEKYVFEAMYVMGYVDEALERHEKRFAAMAMNKKFTTLFEVWNVNSDGYGQGTVNHAWSGGGLIILSQYLCGISPLKPGYTDFQVLPQPGAVKQAKTVVPSNAGDITSSFIVGEKQVTMNVIVPENTSAVIALPPAEYKKIYLNNRAVWSNGKYISNKMYKSVPDKSSHLKMKVGAGSWTLTGIKETLMPRGRF